jgi:hypothetical protein
MRSVAAFPALESGPAAADSACKKQLGSENSWSKTMKRMVIVALVLFATRSTGRAATHDVRAVHAEIAVPLRSTDALAWKREKTTAYAKIRDSRKNVECKLGQVPDQG